MLLLTSHMNADLQAFLSEKCMLMLLSLDTITRQQSLLCRGKWASAGCITTLNWGHDLSVGIAGHGPNPAPRAPRQAPAKVRIPRPPPAPASPRDGPSQPPPELGEYASGRPRRHTKTPGYRLGSNVEDEHQMVEPEHYRGIPGSGAPEAQPFRIEVTPTAQVRASSLHAYGPDLKLVSKPYCRQAVSLPLKQGFLTMLLS